MKERPILFRGAMVLALLTDTKTQTRRLIKPQPTSIGIESAVVHLGAVEFTDHRGDTTSDITRCPFGVGGDRLWVRETWHYARLNDDNAPCILYRADKGILRVDIREKWNGEPDDHWRPSIFLPRWASRITLELTDVRAQRLQDITEADAIAEGATRRDAGWSMDWSLVGEPAFDKKPLREQDISLGTARHAFGNYFEKINGKRAWDENPWVWALTFRRVA